MKISQLKQVQPEPFLVLSLYFLLAMAAFYPTQKFWSSQMIGGAWDSGQNLWNFWWIEYSVKQGNWFPYYTDMLYYPEGVSLAQHPLALFNCYLSLLLRSLFKMSRPAAYNTIAFGALLGSAFWAYLFIKSVTKSTVSAFVGGIIFAFSPYHMSRLHFGHLEIFTSAQFIPLVALFVLKGIQTRRLYFSSLAGIFIALIGWQSLQLALGTALFASLLTLLFGYSAGGKGRLVQQLALMGLTTALLMLPVTYPLIRDYSDFQDQVNLTNVSLMNAPDLLDFFKPDRSISTFWRLVLGKLTDQPLTDFYQIYGQKTVYIGWGVLALIVLSLFIIPLRTVWQWWLIGGVFFILCLGPALHINEQKVLSVMPYSLISSIPLIGAGRQPARWAVFFTLALAVIIGQACTLLMYRSFRCRTIILLAGLLIYGEFIAIPVKLDDRLVTMSPFYQQLAQLQVTGGILDVPFDLAGAYGPACDYMVYQIVHQKPIAGGYISRTPTRAARMFQAYPVMNELRMRLYGGDASSNFSPHLTYKGLEELKLLRFEYIILHKRVLPASNTEFIGHVISKAVSNPLYEDDQIIVWHLPQ